MRIYFNHPSELSLDTVRGLFASKDDSAHRKIRVSENREAYLSDLVGNDALNGVALLLDTYPAGSYQVGEKASRDDSLVQRIFIVLNSNWPNPKHAYFDFLLEVMIVCLTPARRHSFSLFV